jgi:hypothetical protein
MPPNQPDRMRGVRHGIEREFAFERFVSQEFSTCRRCGRCRVSIALYDRILPHTDSCQFELLQKSPATVP